MKKQLSKWVLLLEVVSIVALHAYKHKSDKSLAQSKPASIQQEPVSAGRNILVIARTSR
jgi:hypothetical protein